MTCGSAAAVFGYILGIQARSSRTSSFCAGTRPRVYAANTAVRNEPVSSSAMCRTPEDSHVLHVPTIRSESENITYVCRAVPHHDLRAVVCLCHLSSSRRSSALTRNLWALNLCTRRAEREVPRL